MLQQDLLDTLFLNRKALADVGATGNGSGNIAKAATTTTTTTNPKTSTMKDTAAAGVGADGAEKCPVDHKSREAWLAQARAAQEAQQSSQPQRSPSSIDPKSASTSTSTSTSTSVSSSSSGWGWRIPFLGSPSNSTQPQHQQQQPHSPQQIPGAPGGSLGTNRVVSTIPRSTDAGATTAACPVNHETETGADAKTGNWVYPSEKMFFDAMMRKGHDTRAADMRTVVPIHNAVNEKAWVEIKEWERPYTAERYEATEPNNPLPLPGRHGLGSVRSCCTVFSKLIFFLLLVA